jgi:nucleotide-binding universal stress UspA family protein
MSYAVLMVFVEPEGGSEPCVRMAANLAGRFGATLIGISACAIPPPVLADSMVLIQAPTAADIELMTEKLRKRGDWFRSIVEGDRRNLEWRSALELPNEVIVREARSADLIVIGHTKGLRSTYSSLDLGAAILKMGRPTLVVPEGVTSVAAEHVVIGWKDTREARRAVRDALPFLREATRVTIFEACGPEEEKTALARLDDVSRYLAMHRIKSGPMVMVRKEGSGASQLPQVAKDEQADLLVTGAYGHSRLGEWIFGGVTRELLAMSRICCLMSH